MPELNNPRHEAFARAWTGGVNRRAARVAAGNSPGGFDRVDQRPAFKARMVELRVGRDALSNAGLEKTILALLDLATTGDQTTAAARKEARAARLEAHRLSELLTRRRETESYDPSRPMTEEEWDAKYGPDAPPST
jgi:hypothetical protein